MSRVALASVVVLSALACRPYDLRSTVQDQAGLIPAAQYARYGSEQAKVMAIGRALGQWDGGQGVEARATQVTKAADYARSLPGVASVVADTLGYRLTVTFASGWRTAVLPIADGVTPEDTPGAK
ncbi:MAG: hypothetical protein FJ206_11515 [Gemmatimonadetes bacterium]|nr:hypothetical protein [Gemmatimonadota bacterium]